MGDLFRIETDRILLEWAEPRGKAPAVLAGAVTPPGRLVLRPKRHSLRFGTETWRSEVPAGVAGSPTEVIGPRLFEQTDYALVLRGKNGTAVKLEHRDSTLLRDIRSSANREFVHGLLNFGSQVGRSEFLISARGERELEFEVEVFPTKLDYQTDYQQLLSEVQDILTSLVLEYLRSTFQIGSAVHAPQPTHLEWLTLLRHVLGELEQGLQNIARQPIRTTKRMPEMLRSDRIRRVDSHVRQQVLRQAGSGRLMALPSGIEVREQLIGMVAHPTLDTPEHRWLASQLCRIRRRLAELAELERTHDAGRRRAVTVSELEAFERRISELLRLEPVKAAVGEPPPGFASIQLLSAPGYREAYKCFWSFL
jgi:hypothetical protein